MVIVGHQKLLKGHQRPKVIFFKVFPEDTSSFLYFLANNFLQFCVFPRLFFCTPEVALASRA